MWYIPTNIVSLTLWVLRPNLVLLMTEILQYFRAKETHRLLYLCDIGSHVVQATIQHI